MSRRMRRPEMVRIPLTKDDWIEVKKYLTAGEAREMFALMMRADGDSIDRVKVGLSKVLVYLLDWSFEDADGKPLVIRGQPTGVVEAILNDLPPEDFTEVLKAIEAHEAAIDAALEQEKNAPATASASSAT